MSMMGQDHKHTLGQKLTRRQAQVAGYLIDGETDKTIAAILGISSRTVEFHVHLLMAKLGAATRTRAAVLVDRQTRVVEAMQ